MPIISDPDNKPKLAIIGTIGVPAKYGGFETLVEQLLLPLSENFEVTVYCSSRYYARKERKKHYKSARLKYLPLPANGIGSILYDMISIIQAVISNDLLLILGVSGCTLLPLIKFFTRKRTFVNIDGIEWKRGKWNPVVKTFLRYSEIFAVESADAIIADNQVISDYLKTTYNYDSYLIEYGGDQARPQPLDDQSLATFPFLSAPYAFTVCRIEPENNIQLILEGMAAQNYLSMVMVGNWNRNSYGQSLKSRYSKLPHIHLLDPIYDQKVLDVLRSNCYLYVHGHSAGGTNPSLVEAMNLGLPVLAFDIMYNRVTTENEALYFKDKATLIRNVQRLNPNRRSVLAGKMEAIARRRYTWKIIARKYTRLMLLQRIREWQRV